MSLARYLKLAGIVLVGILMALVEGLAQQQRQGTEIAPANDDRQLESIDQPKAIAQPAKDKGTGTEASPHKPAEEAVSATRSTTGANPVPLRPEPPEALFLPSVAKLSPLDQAYLDAFTILRADHACSNFYGGPRAILVLNDLKEQLKATYIDSSIAVRMRGQTIFITSFKYGFTYRLFERAELNLRGPFYQSNPFLHEGLIHTIGEFASNTREARVTILLHELGHMIENSNKQWLLPDDGNDSFVSHENTLRIVAVCGQEIRHLRSASFAQQLQAARSAPNAAAVQASMLAQ
jgi:hypothetical protein